ncbi:MAG: DUF1499 domain-containing protein [Pseudomonadota bacterium]
MINALSLQCIFVVLAVAVAFGFRQELLPFKVFAAVWALSALSIIVVMIGAILHIIKTGLGSASWQTMVAFVIGCLLLFALGQLILKARSVPSIHDISTDLNDPPQFEHAQKLRKPSDNPLRLTPAVAALQQQHYGDLDSLILAQSPEKLLPTLIDIARDLEWQVHAVDERHHRFEATSTTPLLGFTDDIVVRVAITDKGSRLDMRSVSRVGLSDLGTNAQRIRQYFKAVSHALAN